MSENLDDAPLPNLDGGPDAADVESAARSCQAIVILLLVILLLVCGVIAVAKLGT